MAFKESFTKVEKWCVHPITSFAIFAALDWTLSDCLKSRARRVPRFIRFPRGISQFPIAIAGPSFALFVPLKSSTPLRNSFPPFVTFCSTTKKLYPASYLWRPLHLSCFSFLFFANLPFLEVYSTVAFSFSFPTKKSSPLLHPNCLL